MMGMPWLYWLHSIWPCQCATCYIAASAEKPTYIGEQVTFDKKKKAADGGDVVVTFSLDFLKLLNVSRDTTLPFPVGSSHYKLYNDINTYGVFFFRPAGWYKWHMNPPGGQHMCTWSCLYCTECLHTQTFLCMCRLDPYGHTGVRVSFCFFIPLQPHASSFFTTVCFFCGSSNRVNVAASVSLKQWINNTTVVFWLLTNC